MVPKIGDIVLYTDIGKPTDPRLGLPTVNPTWPALVYMVYPEHNYLGLYVFTADGMRLMRKVSWANEEIPETWRFKT